jgi:hypothetical protein
MATQKTTYEEVGIVLDENIIFLGNSLIGKKVYFDSWLAKKFPVTGQPDKFVWFVKYEDVVAYEPLSE